MTCKKLMINHPTLPSQYRRNLTRQYLNWGKKIQQAKKAVEEANKDGESEIQIFVSSSMSNLDHQDELHIDQVINDEGSSNEVTSSSTFPNDLCMESIWATKEAMGNEGMDVWIAFSYVFVCLFDM